MSESAAVPPVLNTIMKFVLRSPLHGMISKYLTLITFTGRKSGKTYITPVSYSREGAQVFIFTHAKWWKNLVNGAPVTLRLRGQDVHGIAEPVAEDKAAVAEGLTAHLKQSPFDAKYYDVTLDKNGNPPVDQIAEAVKTVAMITVQLS